MPQTLMRYACAAGALFVLGASWILFGATPDATRLLAHEARTDPIAALPGTDLEAAERALRAIERGAQTSNALLPAPEQRAATRMFAGTQAGHALLGSEERRRAFIDHPSLWNAGMYYLALARALAETEQRLDDAGTLLGSLHPRDSVFLISGEPTVNDFRMALQSAREEAGARRHEVFRRLRCVISLSPCTMHDVRAHSVSRSPFTRHVPVDATAYAAALDAFITTRSRGEATTTTPGGRSAPWVSFSSTCVPHPDETPFYAWRDASRYHSSVAGMWTTPLHDLYFLDTTGTKSEYAAYLGSTGQRYIFQPLNAYLCPDAAHDLARILTAWFTIDAIATLPEPKSQQLRKAIGDVSAPAQSLDYAAIDDLAVTLATLLDEPEAYARFAESEGAEAAMRWADLLATIRARSGYYELVLGNTDDLILSNFGVLSKQEIPLVPYLMLRTFPSAVFMLSNRSLFTNGPHIVRMSEEKDVAKLGLMSYQASLRVAMPPEELAEHMWTEARLTGHLYQGVRPPDMQ